jgi:hypothetical protein
MIQQHDVRAGCCWLQLALLVAAGYSWFYMFSKHTFSYPMDDYISNSMFVLVVAGCCWLQLALLVAAGCSWFLSLFPHLQTHLRRVTG